MTVVIKTKRLILRAFKMSDETAMAAINADPLVMKYFPSVGTLEQTQQHIQRILAHQKQYGYSLYALVLKSSNEMIGFVGLLHRTQAELPIAAMPATEIGWRLSSSHWNKGYATEAANAVLQYAFSTLELDEVVSFTAIDNLPSRRVMEKIGLTHCPTEDFNHPSIDASSPLCWHVLYRLSHAEYCQTHQLD